MDKIKQRFWSLKWFWFPKLLTWYLRHLYDCIQPYTSLSSYPPSPSLAPQPPPSPLKMFSPSQFHQSQACSGYLVILSFWASFQEDFMKWMFLNPHPRHLHRHPHCLIHLPLLKKFNWFLSLFQTDFSTNSLMQVSLILIMNKVDYGLLPLEEVPSWAHLVGYSPKRRCLEDLEKWWMLVVIQDIKHAGMYGTVKSCSSLSCSISLSIYLSIYLYTKESEKPKFPFDIRIFHEFFLFFFGSFPSFFMWESFVFQVVWCFWTWLNPLVVTSSPRRLRRGCCISGQPQNKRRREKKERKIG